MSSRLSPAAHGGLLWRLLPAFVALVLTSPVGSAAQAPPLPVDQYWAQVEATQAALQTLHSAGQDERAARLAMLAEAWQQITQVVLEDGAIVAVDHGALLRALQLDPPNPTLVEGMLAALLAARDEWPTGRHDPTDLHSLEAILSRAEFQTAPTEPSALRTWWDNLVGRLDRLLARLFPSTGGGGLASLVSWLLNVVGVLALAGFMAYMTNELLKSLAAEAHLHADSGDGGVPLTADSAFQRAQTLAEGRDYRTAVRYLYLSTLLTLDERGLLRYDRSKTNREYLRSLASQPALAAVLREVIDVFDRVWYGFQPLDAATYARYEARVAELRQP